MGGDGNGHLNGYVVIIGSCACCVLLSVEVGRGGVNVRENSHVLSSGAFGKNISVNDVVNGVRILLLPPLSSVIITA